METLNQQVVVVMVPFPAQGHLNQLLQLSRLISPYNIPIHYIGSATHNRQAKARVHGYNPSSDPNIHFHDFSLPHFLTPPPNPNSDTKFPEHLQPSFDASSGLREPVSLLLRQLSLSSRKVIVIFDTLMASVIQEVSNISNAEAYTFNSVSAFAIYCYLWNLIGKPLDSNMPKDVPSLDGCFTNEFRRFLDSQYDAAKSSWGNLYNTCKLIEPIYTNILGSEVVGGSNKHWFIGPFNPLMIEDSKFEDRRNECLKWLDKQEKDSVIYVSFGTTTALTDDEITEIAIGLEKSKQKFLWVLRDADKGDVFEEGEVRRAKLPKGFEERDREIGFLERDWAPQLEILGHKSVGGFISHCGWNSCIESLTMSVPIAAWPMHSDQPRNTVLITKVLKLGVEVRDWARRDEKVTSVAIENAVRRLMASKEGDDMRTRAKELGQAVQRSMDNGGVSRLELDSFIAHISS